MKVDPNAPAYPHLGLYRGADGNLHPEPSQFMGIPIRLAIAAQIMGHLIPRDQDGLRHAARDGPDAFLARLVDSSLRSADALIAAHNEGQS